MKTLSIVLLAIAIAVPLRNSLWAQTSQQKNPTSSVVEVVGCVDRKEGRFELTNAFWWVVYYLTGRTSGLEKHIGDEVTLRGLEVPSPAPSTPATSTEERRPQTLHVTSVEFMVHKNPEGVRPILGNLDTWVSYENPLYGIRLRYPATFGDASRNIRGADEFRRSGADHRQLHCECEHTEGYISRVEFRSRRVCTCSLTRIFEAKGAANSSSHRGPSIPLPQLSAGSATRERSTWASPWELRRPVTTFIRSRMVCVMNSPSSSLRRMAVAWTSPAQYSGLRRTIASS